MRRPSLKRKTLYVFILFMVINLSLLTLSMRNNLQLTQVDWALSTIISPVQETVTRGIKLLKDTWYGYFYLIDLGERNKSLELELQKLKAQSARFKEIELENHRLKEMLLYKQRSGMEMLFAQVIAREPSNWTKVITINRGLQDGLRKGLPVVSHEGLVGKTISVHPNSSRIMLITDLRSAVDAFIQRTRGTGVVVGEVRGLGRVKYFPVDKEVEIGDLLITSGLGGTFPKGIPIGQVSRIEKSQYGLFQLLEVTPSVELDRIEEVFVVMKAFEPEDDN